MNIGNLISPIDSDFAEGWVGGPTTKQFCASHQEGWSDIMGMVQAGAPVAMIFLFGVS